MEWAAAGASWQPVLAIGNSKKNRKRGDSVGQFSNAHCKCPVLPGSRVVVWQEIKKKYKYKTSRNTNEEERIKKTVRRGMAWRCNNRTKQREESRPGAGGQEKMALAAGVFVRLKQK
jgi:phage/plasmid-associated DNA primase